MGEERKCPKDCKLCSFQQHAYCAAQLAYNNMVSIQDLNARLDKMEKSLNEYEGRYANPLDDDTTIAQSGDGADE